MIDGIEIYPLKTIPDSRGRILHCMRKDHAAFRDFDIQEVYFSVIYSNCIKGWHLHKKMTLNYAVPVGDIKLVLFDPRPESATAYDIQEIYLGEHSENGLVRIPPGIWNGFVAVGCDMALVANITNMIHDPKEIERMHPNSFDHAYKPYGWFESFYG